MKNAVDTALRRRASDITGRIAALDVQKIQLAVELSELKEARRLIRAGANDPEAWAKIAHSGRKSDKLVRWPDVEEMICEGLSGHFRNGATAQELVAYVNAKYGHATARSSLGMHLAKLRRGTVSVKRGVWKLADRAALRSRKDADEAHFLIINPAIGDRL